MLAVIPVFEGKFSKALDLLDDYIAADIADGATGFMHTHKYILQASIYDVEGDHARAQTMVERAREAYPSVGQTTLTYEIFLVRLYVAQGRLDKVEQSLREMETLVAGGNAYAKEIYNHVGGILALEKGDVELAMTHFEEALKGGVAWTLYDIARRYLQAERFEEAVATFDRYLMEYTPERVGFPIMASLAYYYSGIAYEGSGMPEEAIGRYEEFLENWKDADAGIRKTSEAFEKVVGHGGPVFARLIFRSLFSESGLSFPSFRPV